ncbi:MAG: hypothetical protein EOM08_16235 [Clostridia bacterium]|nr:hypothetical protein [Clostridia bacterium]
MLCELMIRNLAVIEQVRLRFAPGFSVLSGETGAGKSIIIDAVGLLLGQRMRADMVRAGAEQGQVEALFDLQQQPQLGQWLHDNGLADPDDVGKVHDEIDAAIRHALLSLPDKLPERGSK